MNRQLCKIFTDFENKVQRSRIHRKRSVNRLSPISTHSVRHFSHIFVKFSPLLGPLFAQDIMTVKCLIIRQKGFVCWPVAFSTNLFNASDSSHSPIKQLVKLATITGCVCVWASLTYPKINFIITYLVPFDMEFTSVVSVLINANQTHLILQYFQESFIGKVVGFNGS